MFTRAILLGLSSVGLLGCFEEAPPIQPTGSSGGTTTEVSTSATDDPTITSTSSPTSTTTIDPTTTTLDTSATGPTTIDPSATATTTTTDGTTTDETSESSTTDPCEAECMELACGGIMGCMCGDCAPDATCSTDQTYCGLPVGNYNPFGFQASVNANVQLGFRFQVFQPRVVRRLGVHAWGAGTPVQMALYDHDGLGPANRLAQTGQVALFANGHNEWDVGATMIMPGDYWVMLHTGGLAPLNRTLNGDMGYEEALRTGIPFGDGFPMFMDDEQVILDYRYNVYMIVEDQ